MLDKKLNPMDVIVFYGKPYNPLHRLISWRTLEDAIHCVTVRSVSESEILVYDIDFNGFHLQPLLPEYSGWNCTIHRYAHTIDYDKLIAWCDNRHYASKGYTSFKQWFMSYTLGLMTKSLCADENRWTCAELPYWCFQQNRYPLTTKEETLPMPREFRFNPLFEKVFEGEL